MNQVPNTPAIVVDERILDANISAMAAFAADGNLTLRPHAKTHKIAAIGQKQLAAGSPGLSVATLSEAQYFFDHGMTDLFIPYPVWATNDDAETLTTLATDGVLAVGTDSVAAVHQLADVTRQHPGVEIMIEVTRDTIVRGFSQTKLCPLLRPFVIAIWCCVVSSLFPGTVMRRGSTPTPLRMKPER